MCHASIMLVSCLGCSTGVHLVKLRMNEPWMYASHYDEEHAPHLPACVDVPIKCRRLELLLWAADLGLRSCWHGVTHELYAHII